ncbi:M23 family metallopeptidase [Planomicrobium okeanokoites]|uniref:M23 family metallopeptidase n=1 Tax=Planomicrobium okeanokoites TaxID=244 RepID=UPI002492DC17|nr:M23 family metallopeptidase [Planomicrobium okeanokoites]
MEVILRMVFIVFIAVSGMVMNHNLQTKAQTLHYLKEDLEVAAHDAALEISEEELASGKIIFDQTRAMTTFRNSFEKNSRLTTSDYEIVEMHFFDENTVSSFPYEFTAAGVNFTENIDSPTLIALVKTSQNAYYANNAENSFVQVASYTYKTKINTIPPIEGVVIGEPNQQGFSWPVPFTRNVTSNFGGRTNPVTGVNELHAGTDIASPGVLGTPVTPARDGKVTYAGWINGYGNIVVIDHGGGIETRYAHLQSVFGTVGTMVSPGNVIGTVGSTGNSTGPHLHFEIRLDGIPYNPMLFY